MNYERKKKGAFYETPCILAKTSVSAYECSCRVIYLFYDRAYITLYSVTSQLDNQLLTVTQLIHKKTNCCNV